jgi:Ca2+-binding EF-hand superfamily protein
MASDFWISKMKTHFMRMDINGDKVVTPEDFSVLADRFIKSGSLADNDALALKKSLDTIWSEYWGGADANNDGKVTAQEFIDSMTRVLGDEAMLKGVGGPLHIMFKAIDANGSGGISANEYEAFFKNIGVDTSLAAASFAIIDTDGSGSISAEEFVTMGTEFFIGDDASHPSRTFWGPRVS